jgi:hypothetical protein
VAFFVPIPASLSDRVVGQGIEDKPSREGAMVIGPRLPIVVSRLCPYDLRRSGAPTPDGSISGGAAALEQDALDVHAGLKTQVRGLEDRRNAFRSSPLRRSGMKRSFRRRSSTSTRLKSARGANLISTEPAARVDSPVRQPQGQKAARGRPLTDGAAI